MENVVLAIKKLSPRVQVKNPVMFVVYIGAILISLLFVAGFMGVNPGNGEYTFSIAIILWLTVLFANYADAIAEGRGRAQADSLKKSKQDVVAYRLTNEATQATEEIISSQLVPGDVVLVTAGQQIPMDGEVIQGTAAVDESAITGESSPVVREAGGDRSAVTGGTMVLSDVLTIRITAKAGESFLDQMINMIEGAQRKKTPNELALQILLVTLTIIFLIVVATLYPFSNFANHAANQTVSVTNLTALLVCLAPTTIGALLSAIGISGMSRLNKENVMAKSGRAIEAAGDVDVLLLDKTGTITLGNRRAVALYPVNGVDAQRLAMSALLSSIADSTPEGRSVVELVAEQFKLTAADYDTTNAEFVPFTAKTRMSGLDLAGHAYRKGATDSVKSFVESSHHAWPTDTGTIAEQIAKDGGTPLVVVADGDVLGVIHLKDIIKEGVQEQFEALRKMGIKSVMITGDNPLTAAAIAAEAGVDDYIAEAVPESKLQVIKEYQENGHLVAMTGDGTNDAPALAQADVAVAMNTGTVAAKEAGNMIDLDSSPTKLIKIVGVGKQLLMTRGALTTFSVANDVAKYFAILPALFVGVYPRLSSLNFMHLTSPKTAILSALIYNALIIIALIPIALRGVKYKEMNANQLLRQNLLIYGLGGLVLPFIVIKIFDIGLTLLGVK
ncbi:potassium-transporting ATPase subunit KdpB [Periweissella ghanensis]|uniref:Potassium-transporting ATPase ATP-binding subunit n=1 Tax=Periweissella ghanensis TaxID=467997 RepID=A0ABN8BQN4_9LACO|nr:potassium-transporting ATPase subunit KdpB [Periweissella ghanensis]MCM0600002.1 potassium-transporting ATPase subunit KdpB [Periweissella ghanensis]CAH0418945.1 Potassium-transporting ATPase ATP-binding subunit [Periweissella ghanensis]